MEEFEPCRFCGGEVRIRWYYRSGGERYFFVECECGANTDDYETKHEAIEAWEKGVSDEYESKNL